ncbi:tRNA pseudouridine(55) synthase TruB [Tenuibacillus multivorans]|uniref:tRNA pseudouridine synthase B n=1 Tax=Tenuibacillus multivorans TaxID=237069 RepID=A0A1G9XVF0_9BACI|nr:tRNA pseudouridine(55) synthase TruB [Tenuibacillus multivorans]GEL75832.1 tRNA pseudouridine synthase B [Tenuibacillus multivorans]SDN00744.1 tRNA pseudouridine55 synthase [Tenuibacillus multivorans]
MNGVIPLCKPKGLTSHDCVVQIRKILKTKKVGHTGTLDPEAEGVLPICVGKATKIASLLTEQEKEYDAEISLGKQTTTEDQVGEVVLEESVNTSLTLTDCQHALTMFQGTIEQTPPMYSAVKVNGKKLYEYAREGQVIDRPSRKVNIHDISMLSDKLSWYNHDDVRFSFKVLCSSGTYIRTLCVDIGKYLGYPAHMTHLIRTRAGSFHLSDTVSLSELEYIEADEVHTKIKTMSEALQLPVYTVSPDVEYRFKHGQVLDIPTDLNTASMVKVLNQSDELIAIYQMHPTKDGKMKPFKVFQ